MTDYSQAEMRGKVLAGLTPARFRIFLAIALLAVFATLQFRAPAVEPDVVSQQGARIHVFSHPDCPHCHKAIDFLESQPDTDFVLHDVSTEVGQREFRRVAAEFGIADQNLGVPLFVYGGRTLIGFESAATTGRELLTLIAEPSTVPSPDVTSSQIDVPIFGEIDPSSYSLLGLTVVMAVADGFNPCAMWVLVYLISLIAGLQDRSKIWWLVGTFVLASGLLYFLFMTAWLNMFLVIGYVRPLTQLIALAAIGFGVSHLYDLAWNRGTVTCEVGDSGSRQRTMSRIRDIVAAPVGLTSLVLVAGLALAVNAIEFVCSAALPAIYTHTLSLMDLSAFAHYAYIGLYVLIFMLDDLVVFGLAAFAVQRIVDTRYAAMSRAAGGVTLLGLGLWMLLR